MFSKNACRTFESVTLGLGQIAIAMNIKKYVFSQMTSFLPKRYFERLVEKSNDRTKSWSISFWNQLLVLIFGQLDGCNSLRELTDITIAHSSKSYHLGFGKTPITRSTLSKANMLRDYRVFESFAYHMVNLAQQKRIDKEFDLNGTFYAFDSTTIDLCLSLYDWARFRSTKSGIKSIPSWILELKFPLHSRLQMQ